MRADQKLTATILNNLLRVEFKCLLWRDNSLCKNILLVRELYIIVRCQNQGTADAVEQNDRVRESTNFSL